MPGTHVRREPRAALCASVLTARLGGKGRGWSQILGRQSRALGNAGEHLGTDSLAVVERKDKIRPAGTREGLV